MATSEQSSRMRALPESALRTLVDAALDVMAVYDVDGRILFINPAVERVLGYLPEQVIGQPVGDYFHPEDRDRALGRLREIAEGAPGSERPATYRLRASDGSYRHLEALTGNRLGDPAIRGIFMVARDVTDRILAEQERAATIEGRRLAARIARIGAWEWDPDTNETIVDDSVRELARQRPDQSWEGPEEFINRFVPEDREDLARIARDATAGNRESSAIARMPLSDGSVRWLYVHVGPMPSRPPGSRRVLGLIMDITAQKQAEQQFSEHSQMLALATWGAGLGVWTWDVPTDRIVHDEASADLLGLPGGAGEYTSPECESQIHPDDLPEVHLRDRMIVSGETDRLECAYRARRQPGAWNWVFDRGRVSERGPDGRALRVVGVTLDFDETKQREQLWEIGERIAQIGSWEFDVGGDRFYWSDGTYRIFELPRDFVPIPGSTRGLLSPASQARLQNAFETARGSGRSFDLELDGHTDQGRPIWVRILGRVEMYEGRPVRVYGIVQDVTERRALESALLEVSDREQHRFGAELHDGLGQELTGISLLLQGLSQQVETAAPMLADPLQRISRLLSQAIGSARALAHGLAPVSTGRAGLEAALRVLADRSSEAFGVRASFESCGTGSLRLDETAGNHLYRIAQEAVSNAVRHGRATRVTIGLDVRPESVTLTVADDGRGIPPAPRENEGLGLRSMAYRARSLDGSVSLAPRRGGGTVVSVDCPQPLA